LGQLSHLGHFLKGSAATLGVVQLRAACEQIQYLGRLQASPTDTRAISDDEAFRGIAKQLEDASAALAEVRTEWETLVLIHSRRIAFSPIFTHKRHTHKFASPYNSMN
jgi:HPt (histidine-containing phosphotransfer) domain-containing protein